MNRTRIFQTVWVCRTLPSNLALCVNPDFDYVRARDSASGRVYVVAAERLPTIPGAVPKAKKGAAAEPPTGGWQARWGPTPSIHSLGHRALMPG